MDLKDVMELVNNIGVPLLVLYMGGKWFDKRAWPQMQKNQQAMTDLLSKQLDVSQKARREEMASFMEARERDMERFEQVLARRDKMAHEANEAFVRAMEAMTREIAGLSELIGKKMGSDAQAR